MYEIDDGHVKLQHDHPPHMTAAQALERSILKWQFVLKNVDEITSCGGIDTCALCENYYSLAKQCAGCPVKKATGRGCCEGTPFVLIDFDEKDDKTESLVRGEIHFLESLRPSVGLITIVRKARPGGR